MVSEEGLLMLQSERQVGGVNQAQAGRVSILDRGSICTRL